MGKIIAGILATVLLTAAILFILDAPYAQWTIEHLAALGGNAYDLETDADTVTKEPSIGTGERQIVYQTQQSLGHTPQATADQSDKHTFKSNDEPANNQAQDNMSDNNTQMTDSSGQSVQHQAQTAGIEQQPQLSNKSQKHSTKNKTKTNDTDTFEAVTEDYFSDAVFIGDSRTVGMQQSGLLPNATYYAKVGIGIGDILTQRIVYDGGTMITVKEALSRHSFGKVYLMVGINDMSSGDKNWFQAQYQEILRVVQSTQPNALIYIQGNIPMSYAAQDLSGSLNNQNLVQRNEKSRQLADKKSIFYLDIASVYADANGHLNASYTSDGLHILSRYYPLWVTYLMQHAIVRK